MRADRLLLPVLTDRNCPTERWRRVHVDRKAFVELPQPNSLTGQNLLLHPGGIDRIHELPREQIPPELREELVRKLQNGIVLDSDITEQILAHRRRDESVE